MKRLMLFIGGSLVVSCLACFGQGKHELKLAYGIGTANQIVRYTGDVLGMAVTFGHQEQTNRSAFGPFFLNYNYFFTPYMHGGLSLGADHLKGDIKLDSEIAGTFDYKAYIIAYEHTFEYLRTDMWKLYSGIGLGANIAHHEEIVNNNTTVDKSKTDFIFHVNTFGARFGKQVGIVVETGVGYKGFLTLGLSARF